MALLTSELARCKAELGFNALSVGAEPYASITRYFELVVLPNLQAGAVTSSSTSVTAATTPTPVTLTLASATGFDTLARVAVDVDDLQETATVRTTSGSTITVALKLAHSGTYPVTVEGGESIVREYLARLRKVAFQLEKFGTRAGIKRVNEIEFFGGSHGRAQEANGFQTLVEVQRQLRKELCMLLFGVGNIGQLTGSGSRVSVY